MKKLTLYMLLLMMSYGYSQELNLPVFTQYLSEAIDFPAPFGHDSTQGGSFPAIGDECVCKRLARGHSDTAPD